MDSLHTVTIRKTDLQYLTNRYTKLKYKIEKENLIDNKTIEYLFYCIDGVFEVIEHLKKNKNLEI